MAVRPRVPLVLAILAVAVWSLAIVRADPISADIFLKAGDQLARDWRYREALALYVQAERVGDPTQQRRAGLAIATTSVRVADFDGGYKKAVELRSAYPDDLEVVTAYGRAAWAAGLFTEADEAFTKALGIKPDHLPAHVGLARVLAARNRLEEALDHVLAAVAGAASGSELAADAYATAGNIYKRLRDVDSAVGFLEKYYALVPTREVDRRTWTLGEIRFLRSFGRRVPAQIEAAALMGVHTMPFRLVNDKIVVPARVNGRETVDFMVDTGAEQTVITERAAEHLGIPAIAPTISAGVGEIGLRSLLSARMDSLQIGSLTIRNVPCLIKTPPLRNVGVGESESFSPLALGLSMMVDYRRRQLVLARTLEEQAQEIELPLWFSRLATVRGVVNGNRPASFIVDTGGEVVSISLETASTLPPHPEGRRRIPLQVFGTSGWDRDAYLMVPGVSFAFDSLALKNAPTVVLNLRAPSVLLGYKLGGTVGHRLLSRYRVTLDLQRSVLGLSSEPGNPSM